MSAGDWIKFNQGFITSPQSILASTCVGTTPCVLDLSSPLANPRINQVFLNTVLANDLRIILPAATNYGSTFSFEPIEIIDIVGGTAQTNKGVTIGAPAVIPLTDRPVI